VFVGDVAEVNYKAIQKIQYINDDKYLINGFNSYNVGNSEGINVNSLFCTLRDIIGYDGFPSYDAARKGDIRLSVLNNKRAFEILGWKPKTSFNEGLMLTVSWLARENNGCIF
jgi:UDP-glucose 4-epimerase